MCSQNLEHKGIAIKASNIDINTEQSIYNGTARFDPEG